MVGWHHLLNGYEFQQSLGDSVGKGSLLCYSPWRCRVRHEQQAEQQFVQGTMNYLPSVSVLHHGGGNGTPLQYSCLEPMNGGAWWAAVHGVVKSWTGLSDFTFTFHFHALEKKMATNPSVLAWRIPGTGEPGGLPSMGSHRVGHDWSDLVACPEN